MIQPEKLRILAGAAGILIAVLLGIHFWDQEAFEAWKEGLHPATFAQVLAVLPCIGVPTTPFYLVAGAAFPPGIAVLMCTAGIVGNNLLSWWLAHTFLRERLHRWLARWTRQPIGEENPRKWQTALVIKFAPGLPGCARTYGLALCGLSFPAFLAFNAGISILFALALILLGESFTEQNWIGVVVAAVCLVLLLLLVRWMRKRIKKTELRSDSAGK